MSAAQRSGKKKPVSSSDRWMHIALLVVGLLLLITAACPHLDGIGRVGCGAVGAVLLLAFATLAVGTRAVTEILRTVMKLWG